MRPSLVRMLRTRARLKSRPSHVTLGQLLEIEKDPNVSVFSKALAAVRAHYALELPNLGTHSDSFWQSLTKFEKIEPSPTPDLAPFLGQLSLHELTRGQKEVIGNIAYKSNVLESLGQSFILEYINSLTNNPYRAIELAKRFNLPNDVLIRLYIRANQLAAAESLAVAPNDGTIVDLVLGYAKARDAAGAHRWITRLQAPSPHQLLKIRHFMVLYNLEFNIPSFGIQYERRPKLSDQEKRLVTAINKVIANHPSFLEGEAYQKWARLLLGDITTVRDLIDALALDSHLQPGEMLEILKQSDEDLMLWIVQKMNYADYYPNMTPQDWCVVLKKLKPQTPIELMVEQIRFADCLTSNVISALCRHSPRDLVDMVLSLRAPNEFQILSAWKAMPTPEQTWKLKHLTIQIRPSLYLLRAIVQALAQHHDFVSVAWWIKRYQTEYSIVLPQKLVQELAQLLEGKTVNHSTKFSAPEKGPADFDTTLDSILPPWVSKSWVVEQIPGAI